MTLIKISEFERLPEYRQNYLVKWKVENFELYQSKFGSKTLTELSLTNIMELSEMIINQNESIGFTEFKNEFPLIYMKWFGTKEINQLSEAQYSRLRTLALTTYNYK